MTFTAMFLAALPIGIGATVVMDLWGLLLRRLGVATLNFAMVGRWAGHLLGGRVSHQAIAKAEPVRNELAWGWVIHYATGVLFAMLLLVIVGEGWLRSPTVLPAVVVGMGTVVAPLCFMQPVASLPVLDALTQVRASAISFELIPRISRAQSMDALRAFDAAGGDREERLVLVRAAAKAVWGYFVTRESCGMRDHRASPAVQRGVLLPITD